MPTEDFAEAASILIADFMLVVIAIATIVAGIWLAYSLGQANGTRAQQQRASSRETMFRESEYTEIVAENDDGYGLAVRDVDEGAEVVSFNDRDEIYQNVWISPDELPETADALSERAVQKTELKA